MTQAQNRNVVAFLLLTILVAAILFTAIYFGGTYLMHQWWLMTHHTALLPWFQSRHP
jgi:hypothetical protein